MLLDAEKKIMTLREENGRSTDSFDQPKQPLIARPIRNEEPSADASADSNSKNMEVQRPPHFETGVANNSTNPFDRNEMVRQVKESPVVANVCHHLMKAHSMAVHFGRSQWDFAIELQQLLDLGAQSHVVRMMVCNGWIEHQREVPSLTERKFVPESDVVLQRDSCFVVTEKGLPLLQFATRTFPETSTNVLFSRPVWDPAAREFRLGDQLIKQFRWKAINQEKVLEAFARENWPSRIDDPLPLDSGICPKQRLHDTIKCLNRKHINEGLVKFRGDGTGRGVLLDILIARRPE